jgi:hypothetical protein
LTLLEVDAHPHVVAIPSGVKLGYKQLSITIAMEFVGFVSLSFMQLYFSTFGIYVKRGVSAYSLHGFYLEIKCESFCDPCFVPTFGNIPSMSYTCVHAKCNHPQI